MVDTVKLTIYNNAMNNDFLYTIRTSLYLILVVFLLFYVVDNVILYDHNNPLKLKVEENPKMQDGSQEFKPPIDWESTVQPAPDEEGVTRYLPPDKLDQHGKEDIIYTPQTEQGNY